MENDETGLCSIAFETIYNFIYRALQKAHKLWKYLIRHHHKRQKQCANETLQSMLSILSRLQPQARQSVTFYNDMTFAKHYLLPKSSGYRHKFCDAYASWQKGGVENTMKITPRKCLSFKTPLKVFMKELRTDIKLYFK